MTTHEDLVTFDDLKQHFSADRGRQVRALDGVTLTIRRGETMGIVGESGCGKSTLARAALLLRKPTSGTIVYDDENVTGLHGARLAAHRKRAQMVFQDPNDSLDPRFTVLASVAEPLRAAGVPRTAARLRALEALEQVGIGAEAAGRSPHEFSGGQRQRIAIARAIATDPEFVVLDEPTSALDVSIQAQILNLLLQLQEDKGLTYMFISHNLGVVRHLAHRVAVMYLGAVVEVGPVEQIFARPLHPYTAALLSAVPEPSAVQTDRIILGGDPPSPTEVHPGCSFATRCWMAKELCRTERPTLVHRAGTEPGRMAACHFADAVADSLPATLSAASTAPPAAPPAPLSA